MKKLNTYIILLISTLGFLCLASCQTKDILLPSGDMIEPEDLDLPVGFRLNSTSADDNLISIVLDAGDTQQMLGVYASITQPSKINHKILLEVGTAQEVLNYANANNIRCEALPESYLSFPEGKSLLVPAGKTHGMIKPIQVLGTDAAGNVLAQGRYMLPIRLISEKKTNELFLDVNVRKPFVSKYPLYTGEDMFMVFYLNTAQFDPRLVTDFSLEYRSFTDHSSGTFDIGRILNLRKSTILWNEEEKVPYLNLYPDLKYVLEHCWKYIQPVQESGRKVCLCIEGGGHGIGFCNLSGPQSEELAGQITELVERYGLDGVNLWDRGSNYGKEGMPAMDKKSYPAFIRLLREKLGADKLITLVDFEEPTESFWNVEDCGGIEVGTLIDYAWSGYCDNRDDKMAVVDPYHPDSPGVSKEYPRKPIAGLSSKRYGCINAFWKPNNRPFSLYDDIILYEEQDFRSSGLFIYGEDIRSNMQDQYEGSAVPSDLIEQIVYAHEGNLMIQMGRSYFAPYYGKWLKDW